LEEKSNESVDIYDKPKTINKLILEANNDFVILVDLILSTGYTGVEDNYRIREKLNDIIHQIRKTQDFIIKIKSKSKIKKDCYLVTSVSSKQDNNVNR
jgi:hypothetical protein